MTDRADLRIGHIPNAIMAKVVSMGGVFADEAAFQPGWSGSSRFAELYASSAKRDGQGRSLRDLDLNERLMKWAVSGELLSRAVKSLPDEVRARLRERIEAALAGRDGAISVNRSEAVRAATREILRERGF